MSDSPLSPIEEPALAAPVLSLSYDHAINYAFQQNAIPVVKELRLQNDGTARKDLVLRVTTEPAFAAPVEVRLQGIEADGEFRVAPLDLKLSHDFLAGLNEKVAGWLKVELVEGGETVQSITEPITLLARNEWCGLVALPEILAAFVLPNDPAVMTILGRAADLLRESTGRSSLNGYQDKSRKRAWEQVAAIYKAIAELDIRYINPPASFENSGQKVRFPSEIVSQRFGTCLDLALLFAACCEQAGLRPFVFIHDGHAYGGCWLEERSLPEPAGEDLQHVRKLTADEFITVFETTTIADGNAGTLTDAEMLAGPHLHTDRPFRLALDIQAARSARIHPLPIPGQAPVATNGASRGATATAPAAGIGDREFTDQIEIGPSGPQKPASRIDLWKSRLLDLSLRNRLLNFRETKSTIRILSAEPEHVEDELAAERELSLRPKPKMMSEDDPRHAATYTREQRADALLDHLREELRSGRLHTHLDESEHARRLTELFRSARNALDENGTNTLFAAVGILEWRETEHSDRVHRAPLLLVPVELKRKSVLEGFTLRRIDEETRLNVTLMEMLRQSFRKEIPGLDPLPEDEHGVNVARVLQIFRDAVRDLAGWEVKTEVWLGQFSFTKFLLWKDLADRLEDLTKNRIVRHLIHEAGNPYPNPSDDIRAPQLDDQFHPREILCPRSADSSQLAAVMAAAAGHDFVLEGPPGTGKSQTITNIIAHCLAHGKRVLFVAEKRAALDVVHRRLREDGLEPFCLELHSNKTGKADVLAQFDRSLKLASEAGATDWEHRAAELERLRSTLNTYTRVLHRRLPCGLSAHHCLDYLLPRKDEPTVRLDGWREVLDTPAETLERARELARLLQERSRPLVPLAEHALAPLACEDWSPGWAERTLDLAGELGAKSRSAIEASRELLGWMQYNHPLSKDGVRRLLELIESLLAPEPVGPSFATTPWAQLSADLEAWSAWTTERKGLRATLAPLHMPQAPGVVAIPCEAWSSGEAEQVFQKGRELEILLKEAATCAAEFRSWLQAPDARASRVQLADLVALSESLLSPEDVGAAFATTPWETSGVNLDRWISLVRERVEVRGRLDGYDEAKLLALDLDTLHQKWQKAQSAWFLPKMLNTGSVRSNLRTALPEKVKPDPAEMGDVVAAALRLREINNELATSRSAAEALMGRSWKQGEPEGDQLARIRAWGQTFHQRLKQVAGEDAGWLATMQGLLSGLFRAGPPSYQAGTTDGDRLVAFRDAYRRFDDASEAFTASAALNRSALDDLPNHLSAVAAVLSAFLQSAPRLRAINGEFAAAAPTAQACLGVLWEKGEPAAEAIEKARSWGGGLHARMLSLAGDDLAWLGQFRHLLSSLFTEGPSAYGPGTSIAARMTGFRDQWTAFNATLDTFASEVRLRRDELDRASDHLGAALALTKRIAGAWPKTREWCSWQKARQEGMQLGLAPVIARLESTDGHTIDIPALFERSFRRTLLFEIIERESALRDFFGREHNERIERFRELDEKLATLSRDLIRARLAAGIPRDHGNDDIPKAEIGLLRKEIGKRMRHIPVRQLLGRIPTLLPRLKPCVLMSPLSVAQYLEASHETFDVVIFDEASQIPVWDAIGAIARGTQLIIVGDPKQLPPTNFFSSGGSDDDDDLTPGEYKDLESILDELMTHGLRHKRLQWHYRSRHEGLITFSNRQYYENDLLTFPSPEMAHGGVRFRHLPDARYDKGKSRTNRVEAEALVQELISRLLDEKAPRRSYGVVTFSQAQQQLIENLLDEERRKHPEIENHFGDEPPIEGEPVFVKNLENVQGDERDVIFFSVCYGIDEAGKISMNFGPLNRDGGERRLNVAVTRAKHEVLVFSGLKGDQIDLTRTRARGVRDLKYFLDYADRGPRALIAANQASPHGEADSEFERMVADRIRAAGFEVHHQVGCSGYRIDLAVVDPENPGRYLLGVECDGATYHRAATARDRDKLRQAILEGLGWKLHRIWSTDWWHDSKKEMETLRNVLYDLQRSCGDSNSSGEPSHPASEACGLEPGP
jgi:very-short-patch-repair endonuclease